jgi:hypothetical protein
LLEVSGTLLKSVVTYAKYHEYHFFMHGFPSFRVTCSSNLNFPKKFK